MRVVIFGNSGSGKSSYARELATREGLAHLDLDDVAWAKADPPTRRPLDESVASIRAFLAQHERWVLEGCYASLIEAVLDSCDRMVFLNPGVETCVAHCEARPWEPHKYASKAEQDRNLAMLIEWVNGYEEREGELGLRAHRELFDAFEGPKEERGAEPS